MQPRLENPKINQDFTLCIYLGWGWGGHYGDTCDVSITCYMHTHKREKGCK